MSFSNRRIAGLIAALVIGAALLHATSITRTLEWPIGPDTFRDMAGAEAIKQSIGRTIRRGVPLDDPYYKGEAFWYNPLLPALLAAGSQLSGSPIHVVAARAPAYLNIAAPIAFYLLAATVFEPLVALVALTTFIFIEPFSSWEAATYAPSLTVSTFAQTGFYLALIAWIRYRKHPGVRSALVVGVVLGLTFLAHTAPTALLGVLFAIETASSLRRRAVTEHTVIGVVGLSLLVVLTALIVAAPSLLTPWHYRGQIREPLPFLWLAPSMELGNIQQFLSANAEQFVFNGLALLGLVVLSRAPSPARRIVVTWGGAAFLLFVWAGYAWRLVPWEGMTRLAIVPAHHFLVYFRGAESMLCGVAVVASVRFWRARVHLPPAEGVLTTGVVAVLIVLNFTHYQHRDDLLKAPTFSENQRAAIDWIARETTPGDVFLAPENAAMSMVGVAGRKVVIVDRFSSNPYVDWYSRDAERQALWTSLSAGDCPAFAKHADPLSVTCVLLVEGVTPPVAAQTCGLTRGFEAPPFAVHCRQPNIR